MMPDLVTGVLAARVGAVLAALLAALLACGLAVQRCQLIEAREARTSCEARAEQLAQQAGAVRMETEACRAAVEEQNRQVELLRVEADEQQARAEAAERRVGATRVEYRDRVRRILVAPVPSDCEAAVRWGAQQARAVAQAWREGR